MSEEEGSFGASLIEKMFGLVVFLIGIMSLYYVWTSLSVFGDFGGFFAFLNIVVIGVGLVLMTAKTE